MSRLIDLTGKRFKQLVVVERVEDNILPSGLKEPMWLCNCDCGNTSVVRGAFLRTGHTGSCGCGQTGHNFIDLTGQKFNSVTVVERTENEKLGSGAPTPRWLCRCDCGTMFETRGNALVIGHTKSCGCRKKQLRIKDMIGREYGELTVVSRADDEIVKDGSRYIRWFCDCVCGVRVNERGTTLRSGERITCGCNVLDARSKAEYWVQEYLTANGYSFRGEHAFRGLKGVGGSVLRYDYAIFENGQPVTLIECHGLQHYEPVEFFGGVPVFEKQQEHDRRKRLYAQNNNIRLIEIPSHGMNQDDIVQVLNSAQL